MTAEIDAAIVRLYVIDPNITLVTVYEATVHGHWLRRSERRLPPNRDGADLRPPTAPAAPVKERS